MICNTMILYQAEVPNPEFVGPSFAIATKPDECVQGDPLLSALALAPAPPLASEKRPPLPSHSQVRRRCFVGACDPSARRPYASPTDAQTQASHTAPATVTHIPAQNGGGGIGGARNASAFLAAGTTLIFPLRELRSSVDDASSQSAPLSSPLQSARRSMLPP